MKSASRPYFSGSTIPFALTGIFGVLQLLAAAGGTGSGSAAGSSTPSGFERDDRVHRALHLVGRRAGLDDLELVAEQLLRRLHDLREQRARRRRALQVGERLARPACSSAARRPGTRSACRCTRRRRPSPPRHRRRRELRRSPVVAVARRSRRARPPRPPGRRPPSSTSRCIMRAPPFEWRDAGPHARASLRRRIRATAALRRAVRWYFDMPTASSSATPLKRSGIHTGAPASWRPLTPTARTRRR